MGKLRETFMKKYGLWEYVLFFGGLLIFGKLVYQFMTDTIDGDALDGIALVLSILMMGLPLAILEFARKKAGLKTREENLEE